MKLDKLIVRGFRGFNKEQPIDLDPRLTLIYAPNSYGKTSISESVEWLLYGETSKVKHADSKEEYKGSYRNCHFTGDPCFVEAWVKDEPSGAIHKLRVELNISDEIKKFVDGAEVTNWPFQPAMEEASKPFILQHALKYLLLVKPDERFQGFARLLGLDELDDIQRNIVSLCTKPEAKIPKEISSLLRNTEELEARLASQTTLANIYNEFKKRDINLDQIYTKAKEECFKRVPTGTNEESLLPQLLKIRDEFVSKIFEGRITMNDFSEEIKSTNKSDEEYLISFVSDDLINKYIEIVKLATMQSLIDQAEFYKLGKKIYDERPAKCPFCGQHIDATIEAHINKKHSEFTIERDRTKLLEDKRQEVISAIGELKKRLNSFHTRLIKNTMELMTLKSSLSKLKNILVPKYEIHYNTVENAIIEFEAHLLSLNSLYQILLKELTNIDSTINESKEDAAIMKKFGESMLAYVSEAREYCQLISSKVHSLEEANQVLKYELDTLAGTKDITILIDLLEKRENIRKGYRVKNIIDGLKGLKSEVEQHVATKMLETITNDLSSDVMSWYNEIRTTGDPDVHFNGFDIERTKDGKFKSRRVQIKAKSYDKELVSAVSSLSESKLNALGLCVSIATNLKSSGPFDFLVIDDPIQSWDAEHETQFIEVIKKLIAKGKQIILLSHNLSWINQVRMGCRTLNGRIYKITSYTVDGPNIREFQWAEYNERLTEVNAILQSPTATTVQLQQAEEEIRIVVTEIAAELYFKRKKISIKPNNLNAKETRRVLIESGVQSALVDRISQTFETTDDAHHASLDFAARKQRIQCYHSWCHELVQELDK
ncbi:MAG: AAA family ATPase [Candidatus Omnitrophica bacterium]|nr:AAA family ATPase [Candidatus Omnitrophota bacterium]